MKKNITTLFTTLKSISKHHCTALSAMEVTRAAGTIRFREIDDVTDQTITEYYIGELVKPLGHNRYGVIERRGNRVRTRYTAKSFDEALKFINDVICKNGVRYPVFTMTDLAKLS